MFKHCKLNLLHGDYGSSLVELALLTPLLLTIVLGAVDLGRIYFMSIEVAGATDAGALYGTHHVTDAAGIQAVVTANASDVANLSIVSTNGCECADGTQSSTACSSAPSCSSSNLVYWVNVTTTATANPLFPWPGIPSTVTIYNTAKMRNGGN